MDARQRFLLSIGLLVSLLIFGTIGYVVLEDATVFDAAYMTIITVSTVGFSEVLPLSNGGRLFTMTIIMLGVGFVYYASVALITLLVSGELRDVMAESKIKRRVETARDHIVICGFGRMGKMVAQQLGRAGTGLVIIEHDSEQLQRVAEAGHLYVNGDASEEDTLREAGLERAKALIATLPRDSDNLYVTLTARGLNPDLFIIARAEAVTTDKKLLRAGADRVVCPQIIGATRIASLVTRPNVVDFVDVASRGVEFEIDEVVISEGSSLTGKTLKNSAIRQKLDAIVVAVKPAEGASVFNPPADHVLRAGDTLIIIGKVDTSEKLALL